MQPASSRTVSFVTYHCCLWLGCPRSLPVVCLGEWWLPLLLRQGSDTAWVSSDTCWICAETEARPRTSSDKRPRSDYALLFSSYASSVSRVKAKQPGSQSRDFVCFLHHRPRALGQGSLLDVLGGTQGELAGIYPAAWAVCFPTALAGGWWKAGRYTLVHVHSAWFELLPAPQELRALWPGVDMGTHKKEETAAKRVSQNKLRSQRGPMTQSDRFRCLHYESLPFLELAYHCVGGTRMSSALSGTCLNLNPCFALLWC